MLGPLTRLRTPGGASHECPPQAGGDEKKKEKEKEKEKERDEEDVRDDEDDEKSQRRRDRNRDRERKRDKDKDKAFGGRALCFCQEDFATVWRGKLFTADATQVLAGAGSREGPGEGEGVPKSFHFTSGRGSQVSFVLAE